MHTLHNLQGHFAGTHVLIFTLNRFSVLQFLISVGICSQILGPKYDTLSRPYMVVCGLLDTMPFAYRRLYFVSLILNNSDIRGEDKLFKALRILQQVTANFYSGCLPIQIFREVHQRINFHLCIQFLKLFREFCLFVCEWSCSDTSMRAIIELR